MHDQVVLENKTEHRLLIAFTFWMGIEPVLPSLLLYPGDRQVETGTETRGAGKQKNQTGNNRNRLELNNHFQNCLYETHMAVKSIFVLEVEYLSIL